MEENKIVKLAKNGELTEKLMQDKDFVEKAKEILKKENINENEIFEILKTLEKCINKSGKIKNKEDLENIVGGKIPKTGELAIEVIFSNLGGFLGAIPGSTLFVTSKNDMLMASWGIGLGIMAGQMGGLALGRLIVEKINKKLDK
ncbi:MAG: hypothetical protein RsTaC01_0941 [Candidatus Paraimprobicoccus trichonymphae]|uniref:Uncharacterized protein n=1 Tax=Candidatus Paraimprobicoccus trichonymphae TaxID=3033793 RepID=A0AA48I3D3_9FIRM|nr:MAG: hypothetical protein RsTaC01_0941 [Candidatus Paraimprobicoccus trichonymphae]